MKRKYLLFLLPLMVPILVFVLARFQAGTTFRKPGADALASLSREVKLHPQQNIYVVHSYDRWFRPYANWVLRSSTGRYTTKYDHDHSSMITNDRRMRQHGEYTKVYDNIIHAAARKNQG